MGKVKVIEASKQSRRQRGSFIENQLIFRCINRKLCSISIVLIRT